jgi:hypothetical protein
MSDAKLSLAVLQRIAEFIADLPEDHLAEIADGRARLTFIPAASNEPRQPTDKRAAPARTSRAAAPTVDMSEAREALARMGSRDEGRAYLNRFRAKPELQSLAKLLGLGSSGSKPDLIDRIVERTIGNRLNSAAIRQL